MKIKTAELTRAALNWAVAKCEGKRVVHYRTWLETENEYWKEKDCSFADVTPFRVITAEGTTEGIDSYSTDWAHGGPIIERYGISLSDPTSNDLSGEEEEQWSASCGAYHRYGPTPIIAAMRCYVASKLGDEIELPEDLT